VFLPYAPSGVPSLLTMFGGWFGSGRGVFRRASGCRWAAACLSDIGPSYAPAGWRAITGSAPVTAGRNGLTGQDTQNSCHRRSPHLPIKARSLADGKPDDRPDHQRGGVVRSFGVAGTMGLTAWPAPAGARRHPVTHQSTGYFDRLPSLPQLDRVLQTGLTLPPTLRRILSMP
jgi:hypothetical protein